jgi:hypothetical protein
LTARTTTHPRPSSLRVSSVGLLEGVVLAARRGTFGYLSTTGATRHRRFRTSLVQTGRSPHHRGGGRVVGGGARSKVPQAPAGFFVGWISRNLRGSAGARGPLRSSHPVVIFLDPSCGSSDMARQTCGRSSRQGSRKILHRNGPVLAPSLRSSPCACSVPALKPLTACWETHPTNVFLWLRRREGGHDSGAEFARVCGHVASSSGGQVCWAIRMWLAGMARRSMW